MWTREIKQRLETEAEAIDDQRRCDGAVGRIAEQRGARLLLAQTSAAGALCFDWPSSSYPRYCGRKESDIMIERYAFRIKNDFCQHWPYVHQTWQHLSRFETLRSRKKASEQRARDFSAFEAMSQLDKCAYAGCFHFFIKVALRCFSLSSARMLVHKSNQWYQVARLTVVYKHLMESVACWYHW